LHDSGAFGEVVGLLLGYDCGKRFSVCTFDRTYQLVADNDYKSHVVYLSRYLDKKNEFYSLTDEEIQREFVKYLKSCSKLG